MVRCHSFNRLILEAFCSSLSSAHLGDAPTSLEEARGEKAHVLMELRRRVQIVDHFEDGE